MSQSPRLLTLLTALAVSFSACTENDTDKPATDTSAERSEPSTTAAGTPRKYGDDPHLDQLYDGCEFGDMRDCDDLLREASFYSDYYHFARTCGGRGEPISDCEDDFE